MKKYFLIVMCVLAIFGFSCKVEEKYLEEKIVYASKTTTARGEWENKMEILFDEEGIIKFYKRDEPDGMINKMSRQYKITKEGNLYQVYEELFYGYKCNMEVDESTNEILTKSPETGEIWARCTIEGNVLRFTWKDGDIGFIYTFGERGFSSKSTEYLYEGSMFSGFYDPEDDTVYEVTRKTKTDYEFFENGDFGFSEVTIHAEVNPKTMLQNALNLSIIFQDLHFECTPFLVGRY
jgi:hypothetical protein